LHQRSGELLQSSAFTDVNDNVAKGTKLFRAKLKAQGKEMSKPRRFVKSCMNNFVKQRDCKHLPRSGRPAKMTTAQAVAASKIFKAGFTQLGSGKTLRFSSVSHALRNSKGLRHSARAVERGT